MDWKEEQVKRMTKQMQLVYIESELMNYYWHLAERDRYQRRIDDLERRYEERLNERRAGGGIIRLPDGSQEHSPWQIEWSGQLDELRKHRDIETMYLERVDKWMSVCTKSQESLIRQYVMIQQCRDPAESSDLLGYAADTLRQTKRRVLNKIFNEFF